MTRPVSEKARRLASGRLGRELYPRTGGTMDVMATLRATRILKTAQEGGYFDDILKIFEDGREDVVGRDTLLVERAKALLSGEWADVHVEVIVREFKYKKRGVGAVSQRLHFKLY